MAFPRKWVNNSGTKTYYAWRSMRQRCLNKKCRQYNNYGGRGIQVCDKWRNSYDAFVDDMRECPGLGYSIDRIDNEKGYFPENCRWATLVEQHNNERRNIRITYNGITKTCTEWARTFSILPDTLLHRIRRLPLDRAFAKHNKLTINNPKEK